MSWQQIISATYDNFRAHCCSLLSINPSRICWQCLIYCILNPIESHFRIPTLRKFHTMFHIWDVDRVGYLTPGALVAVVRDFFDLLGLLNYKDHHRAAIDLYVRMDPLGRCRWNTWNKKRLFQINNFCSRVYEAEFVETLFRDTFWVSLAEASNFCVPKSGTVPALLFHIVPTFSQIIISLHSRQKQQPVHNNISQILHGFLILKKAAGAYKNVLEFSIMRWMTKTWREILWILPSEKCFWRKLRVQQQFIQDFMCRDQVLLLQQQLGSHQH